MHYRIISIRDISRVYSIGVYIYGDVASALRSFKSPMDSFYKSAVRRKFADHDVIKYYICLSALNNE